MQYVLTPLLGYGHALLDQGKVPDFLLRYAIRQLLGVRWSQARGESVEKRMQTESEFIAKLKSMPIAIHTDDANEQHYEVPTQFYLQCLGDRLKYSCAYYPNATASLEEAEETMLNLYCERAQLQDGMSILDMGCGWGSLCLYLAERYPNSTIYAVSNSSTQKAFIDKRAGERNLSNLTVYTADIAVFEMDDSIALDRVMSIEMLEHMKNYGALFEKVSRWLKKDGKMFAHIFTFEYASYHFEPVDDADWMAKHFFSGGTMPSTSLFLNFQEHLLLERQWKVPGQHYHRTCEHWLQNMDKNEAAIREIFTRTYGADQETLWVNRWRCFYIACSEMFAYNGGCDWYVSHYLFTKR